MTPEELDDQIIAASEHWKDWINAGNLNTFSDGIEHAPQSIEAEGLLMALIEFIVSIENENENQAMVVKWIQAIIPLSAFHLELSQLLGLAYAIGWAQAKEHSLAQ